MIAAAESAGVWLAVGHTERFNPAFQAALPMLRHAAVHRGPPAERLSGTQPRHRRDLRRDDSRPRHRPGHRRDRGDERRSRRRARADVAHRHRQRAREVRIGLRREHHGQPHQPRQGPEAPLLSAGHVRVGRLRGAGARSLAASAVCPASARPSRADRSTSQKDEPLRRELADFVDAVVDGRAPGVTGQDGRRALALAARVAEAIGDGRPAPDQTGRPLTHSGIVRRCFLTSRRSSPSSTAGRSWRASASRVSPDLEIAAVIDRACKSPGGGPALLFEQPTGASMPVAANLFGSMSRICLALGVDEARRAGSTRSRS